MRRNFTAPRQLLPSSSFSSTTSNTLSSEESDQNPRAATTLTEPTLDLQTLHIDNNQRGQQEPDHTPRALQQPVSRVHLQPDSQLLCSEDSLTDSGDSRHTSLSDSDSPAQPRTYTGFEQYPIPVVPQTHYTWYSGPDVCDFPSGQVLACQLRPDVGQLLVYSYCRGQWLVTTYHIGTLVPAPDWYWWE